MYWRGNLPRTLQGAGFTEGSKIKKDQSKASVNIYNPIKRIYALKKGEILRRLKEFKNLWFRGDEEIFAELAFCILTPQSKAKVCWEAIERLRGKSLLLRGSAEEIKEEIRYVRFKNKKTEYFLKARNFFSKNGRVCMKSILSKFKDIHKCREWLVKNITGLGYKEASHFLRNIGFGEKIAILDRHILRNLKELGIIEDVPESLSRSKYLDIEKRIIAFSRQIDIPFSHLDLLLWYKETGEIFK
ncbi:MAG: N-glycosylase/DNA lyase [Thermodesulfovibrionales bacterium]|nr:N-glycosylase/DNA lyase [Thermodesulfovibrionales bacterium]